jgi:hypothetical protein
MWGWSREHFCLHSMYMRPPLWSSGQSSWLQIQIPGFDSQRYHIFREVMGLERGLLSIVSTIEELLERKSSGSGLESREYGSRDPSRWSRGTLYPQKLALTSPTSGFRSVGIVRSRTQATEFNKGFFLYIRGYWRLIESTMRCLSLEYFRNGTIRHNRNKENSLKNW